MQEENFLDENQPMDSYVINVFQKSELAVFRAVDSELRKRYTPLECLQSKSKEDCFRIAGERKASKSQLARHLFRKEYNIDI